MTKRARSGQADDWLQREKKTLHESEGTARSTVDALSAHIAILDETGAIIAVNRAWRRFAEANQTAPAGVCERANYLAVCDAARGADAALAAEFAAGVRAVMHGDPNEFSLEYSCHSPDQQRWFTVRVSRFTSEGIVRVVVAHENITERKRMEAELSRSREALRALANRMEKLREEERTRMAREVHDELGHAFTDLRLDLGWLARRLEDAGISGRTAIRRRVSAMSRRAEDNAQIARRIAADLRPAVLDELGLAAAIEWQAKDWQRRMRIRCDVEVRGALPALDTEQATALFRVFQEILSNVARHARATSVQIRMADQAGRFVFEVSDNGRGITQTEQSSPIALGLLGMRERIENLGGEVTIQGAPDAGTIVTVSITIKPA